MSDDDNDNHNDTHAASSYNDTHRAFLQALLAQQTLTFDEARPLLAAIHTAATPARPTLPGDITQEDLHDMLDRLHDALSPFDLEIRSMLSQTSRERVWALVNSTSDPLTQLATTHSPDEMAFVKRVLDAIFDANNTARAEVFAVRSTEALKLRRAREADAAGAETQGGKAAALTMAEAERVLEVLVAEGWLACSRHGFYSPTERLLLELNRWLRDVYNDEEDDDEDEDEGPRHVKIKDCVACRTIITVGQRCPNVECEVRLHDHCVERFFHGRTRRECPTCRVDWADPLRVGEEAARRPTNVTRSSITNGHERDDSDEGGSTD